MFLFTFFKVLLLSMAFNLGTSYSWFSGLTTDSNSRSNSSTTFKSLLFAIDGVFVL
jgi:hypothetical protein